MFCSSCGKEVHEGASFCSSCGATVGINVPAPREEAVPANIEEVREHLKNAKILETRIYELDCLIESISQKIKKLRTKKEVKFPKLISILDYLRYSRKWYIVLFYIFYLVIAACIFPPLLIAGAIPIIVYFPWKIYKNFKRRKKYKADVEANDARYRKQLKKAEVLEKEKEDLQRKKEQAEEYLKKLYSADILFSKYREMIPVITMYEYFMSGRCTRLDGYEGAYNLFESELRQNIIINSLQNIYNALEQIRQNQYMLYEVLCDIRSSVSDLSYEFDGLSGSIGSLNENAKITAYNSRIAAENSSINTYLNLFG